MQKNMILTLAAIAYLSLFAGCSDWCKKNDQIEPVSTEIPTQDIEQKEESEMLDEDIKTEALADFPEEAIDLVALAEDATFDDLDEKA